MCRRASLLAAIVLILLAPAATSTIRPKQKLNETRDRLEHVRERLSAHESHAQALKQRISELNHAITGVQIALNELDAEIARTRSEVRSAEARRSRTQAEIDAIRDIATSQAVQLYKSGSIESLSALLEARSVVELNDRIEMLGVAARSNTGALVRYGRLRLEIEAQNRILFAKQAKLERARASQADVLAHRSKLQDALRTNLRRLNDRIGRTRTREGRLQRAAAALRKRIVAAQARTAATSLGTSSEGFIWPLNGPVTSPYGPRWGSMHTGIDIDGYTGQPVVAVRAGRVILGAGMSGYGNALVVDHGGGLSSLYAHLSGFETGAGATVDQGDVVGYVGCTGNCYGDHLHLEIRVGGAPVDPFDYLP